MEKIKCDSCGYETPLEEMDFQLDEAATMTCPVCNSKIEITAKLLEPGTPGPEAEELPPSPEELPGEEEEEEEEELPSGEEEMMSGEEEVGQITPRESVEERVAQALKDIKEGKDDREVISRLLNPPMRVHSPAKLEMGVPNRFPSGFVVGSGESFKNEYDYGICFSLEGYVEIYKDDKVVTQFHPDEVQLDFADSKKRPSSDLQERKVIDVTPSPAHYRHMLKIIMQNSRSKADRDWAKEEYERVKDVKMWRTKDEDPMAKDKMREFPEESKKLNEKEDELKDWKGDFATFNAKLYGCAEDLNIPMEEYEKVIQALQDKDAIGLTNDKVELDLKKTKDVLVDYLKGRGAEAEEVVAATDGMTEPPPEPQDLGNDEMGGELGSEVPPIESKVTEQEEGSDSVDDDVEQVLRKYFA